MHATCPEDLQVFQRAQALAAAVFALTRSFQSHYWLRDQLDDCAESIAANIAEGFSQGTDRAFARYLVIAHGSAGELRVHLVSAGTTEPAAAARAPELMAEAAEIQIMLGAFIRYLRRSDRKDRPLY